MFEGELVNCLRANSAIAATVTTYNGIPAIFADEVPESAEMPYVVIEIHNNGVSGRVITQSDVNINYFDYDKSRATADTFSQETENALDQNIIKLGGRLSDVRFSMISCGYVKAPDPRTIQYNFQFSTRGSRSSWMIETQ